MRILILGGDGYLGWPTAMHLSARGHDVAVVEPGQRTHLPSLATGVAPGSKWKLSLRGGFNLLIFIFKRIAFIAASSDPVQIVPHSYRMRGSR